MFRYNYYYGHWSSDSDSDGGDYSGRNAPNLGEGGRDVDFSPQIPPPPPPTPPPEPVPPITARLVDTTPAIMTLNEIDEFNGSAAGYIPAGQFTEARAFPLSCVKATKAGVSKMVTVRNERSVYDYSPMGVPKGGEIFRFPYYVPPGANLATLPIPEITFQCNTTTGATPYAGTNVFTVGAWLSNGGISSVVSNPNMGSVGPNTSKSLGPFTLALGAGAFPAQSQFLSFTPGEFNDFKFWIKINDAGPLSQSSNFKLQWMVTNIKTSLPTGYELELKLQKNWTPYFNINVVKDINRSSKGTIKSLQSIDVPPAPIGDGYTLTNNWEWNEYDTGAGYKHWEIPVTTLKGNYQYKLTPIVFPENDEYCSMEPTFKLPGPKAPWNLLSRHESFGYAQTWMRKTDYSQYIGTTPGGAIFYCPRNWRAIVWLKQGTAINDII